MTRSDHRHEACAGLELGLVGNTSTRFASIAAAVLVASPLVAATTVTAAAAPAPSASITLGASDWPTDRYNNDRISSNAAETGLSAANVGQLHLAWSTSSGDISQNPVVVGNDVFATCGLSLCSYDRVTGGVNWSTAVPRSGEGGLSAPTVGDGLVFIGGGENLDAVDAGDGKVVWADSFTSDPDQPYSYIYFSPVYDSGRVFVSTNSGAVHAVDAATGVSLWVSLNGGQAELAADSGYLYTGSGALDEQTGKAVTGGPGAGYPGPAVISGGRVLVGYEQMNAVGNHDPNLPLGHDPIGDPTPPFWFPQGQPAVANNTLYFAGQFGTGFGGYHSPDMPLEAPQLNALKLTDPASGGFTHDWQTLLPVAAEYDWTPTVANGVVYVLTITGQLYAADATTGALLWDYSTNSPWTGNLQPSPVIADGMLFIQTGSQLFAFTTDPGDQADVPAAPTQLVTSDGDGQVTLAWTEPSTAGAATSYQIDIEPSGRVVTTRGTALTIAGLSDWTHYTFTITPLNGAGTGPPLISPTITPRPQVTIADVRDNGTVALYGAGKWLSLGGQATSAPAVVTISGDPYVFVRGPDYRIWVRSTDQPWQRFGPMGTCASGPAVTATTDGLIDVACRATDNHLLTATSPDPATGELPHASGWSYIAAVTLRGRPAIGRWDNPDGGDLLIAVRPTTSDNLEFFPSNAFGTKPAANCGGSPTLADTPLGDSKSWACQTVHNKGQPEYFEIANLGLGSFIDPFVGQLGLAKPPTGPVVVGVNKTGDVMAQIPRPSGGWGVQGWRGAGGAPAPVFVTIGHHAKYGAAAAVTYHEQ